MGRRAVMSMPAEQMAMAATGSAELAIDIKEPKSQEQRPPAIQGNQ